MNLFSESSWNGHGDNLSWCWSIPEIFLWAFCFFFFSDWRCLCFH